MNKNLGYILTAILSGIAGWFFYSATHMPSSSAKVNPKIKENFGKTTVEIKDGKYFLIYNGVIDFSKEITLEEYNAFMTQYPTGVAPINILSRFSSNAPKYTKKGGKYYEYIWDGEAYGSGIEITAEEYAFLTNKQIGERFAI